MEEDLSLDNICKQYYQTIYRYCLFKTNHNTHLADDITSDVIYLLIQKWENLSKDSSKGLLAWLYKTAQLKILEYSRKPQTRPLDTNQLFENFDTDYSQSEIKKYYEYIDQIRQKLPAQDYTLFCEIIINQKSYTEIARSLGISKHALQLRWYRVRLKLAQILPSLMA